MTDAELNELRRDAEAVAIGLKNRISPQDLMRLFDYIDDLQDQLKESTDAYEELEKDYYHLEHSNLAKG